MGIMQRYLILDYETRSEADLKKVGGIEYARDASTEIICVAWKLGTKEELQLGDTKAWSPFFQMGYGELKNALLDPAVKIVAHNAAFEQAITKYVLTRYIFKPELKTIPPERFICTAAIACALALPRNLEGACQVMGLPIQKDMEGRRLILKYCKPRKATLGNKAKWHQDENDLKRLIEYCKNDVDAETELFLRCPPLNETETRVWNLDQKINQFGFLTDRKTVQTVLKMIDLETTNLNAETARIAAGAFASTTQRAETLKWLKARGIEIDDLQAKTVADYLAKDKAQGDAKRIMEIRQAISKTSTAKYEAFECRSRSDGRVRDNLVYHAASTGRWGGSGVQPQNFARGKIKNTELAADILASGDLELVRLCYENPMEAFSSCLRAMIIAPPGRILFGADYNAIEARVLFWLSEHTLGLKVFEAGYDLYVKMAAAIYGIAEAQVSSAQRELGKRAVLGCGYGMGANKFFETCNTQGFPVSEDLAAQAVAAYRETHIPVPVFWRNTEKAAIVAVKNPGKVYTIGKIGWVMAKGFLWALLPSGRRLAYKDPEIKYEKSKFGDVRPTLHHYGLNPITKKWELSGTYGGRLVENVTQAVARDIMAEAMLRVDAMGYDIILTVHDEILAEGDPNRTIDDFERIMGVRPDWAKDCPIKVKGYKARRYRK